MTFCLVVDFVLVFLLGLAAGLLGVVEAGVPVTAVPVSFEVVA